MKRIRSLVERALTGQSMTPNAGGGRTRMAAPRPEKMATLQTASGNVPNPLTLDGGAGDALIALLGEYTSLNLENSTYDGYYASIFADQTNEVAGINLGTPTDWAGNFTVSDDTGHGNEFWLNDKNGVPIFEAWHRPASTANPRAGFFGSAAPQQTHINDPAGGTVVDDEARSAINAVLDLLQAYGLMAP
jgi:hypothetical protein